MITLALGLPHTPWVPARAESFARVMTDLLICKNGTSMSVQDTNRTWGDNPFKLVAIDDDSIVPADGPQHVRIFDERASNKVWPRKMWQWMLDTGASHCLTLQDDVIVSPDFWPVFRAMIESGPARIIGLSAVHPLGPEQARQGRRWYRTQSWIVGWAYCLPREVLARFVAWFDANLERVAVSNEDQLLNDWILETQQDTWHPVPSIVDHDTSIESTYGNDDHTHRRCTVTWRGYAKEDLTSVDWWRSGDCQRLPLAWQKMCWSCMKEPIAVRGSTTGMGVCCTCVAQFSTALMRVAQRVMVGVPPPHAAP